MTLHVQFEDEELRDLQLLINRGLNTWEPAVVPKFVWEFEAAIVARINDVARAKAAEPEGMVLNSVHDRAGGVTLAIYVPKD